MEKDENALIPAELLEDEIYKYNLGKYQTSFTQLPSDDPEKYERMDLDIVTLELNGAICYYQNHCKHKIKWKKVWEEIEEIDFTFPYDNAKLSDVFNQLPYGLIKKNRTGVGATTLELQSPRNSIVVVPTRALAYEKAKHSKDSMTGKYKVLYVGGQISGFNPPSINNYLNDNNIEHKKFIVVIDSLPTLLNEIGEENFKDYFIMFDEIDSYQYDASFRPNMEKGFEYYFKFPETNRCLISATVGEFTNPRINEEPVINLVFNNPAPRNIELKETNDVLMTTKKHIEHLLANYPNQKILVAFNLLKRGILPIIKSLSEENQAKCAVLCAEKNKTDVGEMYCDIVENKLPKQITFMTCTYFVGIDIQEPFHLISVADTRYPFTLLSTEKLQQIAGRCRISNGLLSETVIYNIAHNREEDMEALSQQIVKDAQALINFFQLQNDMKSLFPELQKYKGFSKEEIIESSIKKYGKSSPLHLIKESPTSIAISYFNIDNILIQNRIIRNLYNSSDNLKSKLISEGHSINCEVITENESINPQIHEEIAENHQRNTENEREDFITQLMECTSIPERERLAYRLMTNCQDENKEFLKRFIEMQKYVPIEKLTNLLTPIKSHKAYQKLKKQICIWALEENHPIKATLRSHLAIGHSYTSEEITNAINSIVHGILSADNLNNSEAVRMLKLQFCEVGGRTTEYRNHRRVNVYPILSYDVLGLNCEPVEKTPSTQNMKAILR